MFGRDNQSDQNDDTSVPVPVSVVSPADENMTDPSTETHEELNLPAPAVDSSVVDDPIDSSVPQFVETPAIPESQQPNPEILGHDGSETEIINMQPDTEAAQTDADTVDSTPELPEEPVEEVVEQPVDDSAYTSSDTTGDLEDLRQKALRALSPLISQLNQSPEQKYATAKMVYEETGDKNLLTAIYEAAQNLNDETAKAEAIYDVIQKIDSSK